MKTKKILGTVQQKQKALSNMNCILMWKHRHERNCPLGSAYKTAAVGIGV